MNQIAVRYQESPSLFFVDPSQFERAPAEARPIIQEMLNKLNSIPIKKYLTTWIIVGILAILLFISSIFLVFISFYLFALTGFGILLFVLSIVMFRLNLKKIRKKISAISVEFQQKLSAFYEVREQTQILMRASRTVIHTEVIILTPVRHNQEPIQADIQAIEINTNTEPIPFYRYNPKKKEGGNKVVIGSETDLITQPITPFHEVQSPLLKNKIASIPPIVTNFQDERGENLLQEQDPQRPDENNPVVEVRTLPPTPQNFTQPQDVRMIMDSVYVIPGRRIP